jgi:hypothetical protein
MMARRNITAHTLSGSNYPAFLSVNHEEDGQIEFTVRSSAKEDGTCGDIAVVKLSREDFRRALQEMQEFERTDA